MNLHYGYADYSLKFIVLAKDVAQGFAAQSRGLEYLDKTINTVKVSTYMDSFVIVTGPGLVSGCPVGFGFTELPNVQPEDPLPVCVSSVMSKLWRALTNGIDQ